LFGVRSLRVLADLAVAEDVDRAVAEIVAEYGRIDVLVHNAGGDIAADGGKADPNDAVMIKDEDVLSIMNNNLQSSILICQRVARVMIPQVRSKNAFVSRRRFLVKQEYLPF
jgi:3-oxoacyl-[acyl-carrier protein] reductase